MNRIDEIVEKIAAVKAIESDDKLGHETAFDDLGACLRRHYFNMPIVGYNIFLKMIKSHDVSADVDRDAIEGWEAVAPILVPCLIFKSLMVNAMKYRRRGDFTKLVTDIMTKSNLYPDEPKNNPNAYSTTGEHRLMDAPKKRSSDDQESVHLF